MEDPRDERQGTASPTSVRQDTTAASPEEPQQEPLVQVHSPASPRLQSMEKRATKPRCC